MSNTVPDGSLIPSVSLEDTGERLLSSCITRETDLSRWLALNRLEKTSCLKLLDKLLLDTFGIATETPGISNEVTTVDPSHAWKICCDAISSSIPSLRPVVEKTFNETSTCLRPRNSTISQSFTYDRGFHRAPFVYVDYSYSSKSLISLAHEFGHALQITASNDCDVYERMPPISRECCAFVAEHCLIDYARHSAPVLFSGLVAAWAKDNLYYLVDNAETLKRAFNKDTLSYHYSWNYPLARLWLHWLWNERHDNLADLFHTNGTSSGHIWALKNIASGLDSGPSALYSETVPGDD